MMSHSKIAQFNLECKRRLTFTRFRATTDAVEKQEVLQIPSVCVCVCVCVVLGTQREMRMPHTFISGLSGSTIFFHIIS